MQYFKNVELASLYPVSEGAVRKWISLSEKGKLELQLVQNGDKNNIANTASNIKIIEELVEKGKKYKNGRGKKKITPKEEFYKVFDKRQIVDIINNIQTFGEVPLAYTYFNGGAEYWDKYIKKLSKEPDDNNTLGYTKALLRNNLNNIEDLIKNYSRVNIVDLGAGNGMPVKDFLRTLMDREILGRYIAIDASTTMLDILEGHMNSWFGDELKVEKVVKDFGSEKFDDVLVEESLREDYNSILNIIFVFSGTLSNFKDPQHVIRVIRNSMGSNDLLMETRRLDNKSSRRFFDFNPEESIQFLSPRHKLVPDLLGIEDKFYEVKQEFDPLEKVRSIKIKLKVDLEITIKTNLGNKKVELYKNKEILLWRAWHQNYLETINFYDKNDFSLLFAAKTADENYILAASKVNCED